MIPTGLIFVFLTEYYTNRENCSGPLLRLHGREGKVELLREHQVFNASAVVLKLQIYRGNSDEDYSCELNLQTESSKRFPLAKTLGKDRHLKHIGEELARLGLRFEEEDLRGFKPVWGEGAAHAR
jgi:hypothetical protein